MRRSQQLRLVFWLAPLSSIFAFFYLGHLVVDQAIAGSDTSVLTGLFVGSIPSWALLLALQSYYRWDNPEVSRLFTGIMAASWCYGFVAQPWVVACSYSQDMTLLPQMMKLDYFSGWILGFLLPALVFALCVRAVGKEHPELPRSYRVQV